MQDRCLRPLAELGHSDVPLGEEFREPMPHSPPDEPESISDTEQVVPPGMSDAQAREVTPALKSQSVTSSNPKDIAATTKRQLQLIPPVAEEQIAAALKFGADRYGPWNWRGEKILLSNYLGALKRHLCDLMKLEDVAPDSQCHHVAHIGATACILLDALAHDCVIDDRPGK